MKQIVLSLFLFLSLSLQAQAERRDTLMSDSLQTDSVIPAKPSAFKRAIRKFMNFSDFDTLYISPNRYNYALMTTHFSNFEYYSEDPLLAGMMAAAMTLGVQKVPGCGTTIKHFACNNQEDNRMGSDSILSERALREIYLKGFEIAVKDAQPMSIMTSYNLINGVHAANCYDTCTKAARDEWGFAGAIMTDWTTTNVQIQGECTAAGCMRAGNDMVMPGLPEDHENIKKELADGTLTMAELKRCIYNTVNIVLQSNMYEGAVSYLDQFDDLDTYLVVK